MPETKKVVYIMACISFLIMVALIVLVFIPIAGYSLSAPRALAVIVLLSYHTTLSLDSYANPNPSFTEGVVRNAIAATFMVMYIIYFAFALGGKFPDANGKLFSNFIDNLATLIGVIMAFILLSKEGKVLTPITGVRALLVPYPPASTSCKIPQN